MIMGLITETAGGLLWLVGFVCFILVLVQMFQRGETKIGVITLVLCLCCVGGYAFAFIYGWIKSSEWGLQNVMLIWTTALIISLLLGLGMGLVNGFNMPPWPD